ncbi:MAG: dephospho-CoA kinase [Bacteroidales bacterium]|nr:dephospho-CoA kinase [Bacteroidales bacterium]
MLIGLTGGIGCGKTTVLEEFRKIGVPCFIADSHAANYYNDENFLAEVRMLFGNSVFKNDGKADKKKIAEIVFSNHEALLKLNALVHPRVMKDFHDWADEQIYPYVIMESAIIYEYGLDKYMDKVITVYLEKEERMKRLELRDKITRAAIEARMNSQLSAEEKMDRADYVILNYEGNPRSRQVKYIDKKIIESTNNKI